MLTTSEISEFGSSPLTRGTQRSVIETIVCTRFIPAYAGNSRKRELLNYTEAVHPRLRGELKYFNKENL